jgi:short-subunit dehydrogenase
MKKEIFEGKSVIITGASSGIGRSLALRLATERAWLTLAARDEARLGRLKNECERLGGRAIAIPTDISDERECQKMIGNALECFGRIDMLINNAGMSMVSKIDEMSDLTLFKQVMNVNFYGMVHCTFHALRYLMQSHGQIVNISSIGGFLGVPYNSSYVSSKFAMNGFTESLRIEVARDGVSVTLICPYWVITEFHERYLDKNGVPKGAEGRQLYTPKMMTADQCAEIIIEAARKRTRQVIMSPGIWGQWLKLIAPGIMDRMTIERFLKPISEKLEDTGSHGND